MQRRLILILGLAGFSDALMLWMIHGSAWVVNCFGNGCESVQSSIYAELWGFPVAMYGTLLYLAVVSLAVIQGASVAPRMVHFARSGILLLAAVGAIFSGYLTWIEGIVLRAWCSWCLLSFALVLAILCLAISELLLPLRLPSRAMGVRGDAAAIGLTLAAALPLTLLGSRSAQPIQNVSILPPELARKHLVRPDSHWVGSPSSKIDVVEFADLQCAGCGEAQDMMRIILAQYGSRIRFVFRHLPLPLTHRHAVERAEAAESRRNRESFGRL